MTQNKGKINRGNPIYKGKQPVRVLHYMNLFIFQNSHPTFSKQLTDAFTKDGFSKTIDIIYEDEPIKTPYIRKVDKTIVLQETFLSYLWILVHNIYTLYVYKIDYPRINKKAKLDIYEIDEEAITKAEELFQYAKSLKVAFSKWDIEYFPNPEYYDAEKRDFIEQPNVFYSEAIKFILAHEYIHAIKHINTSTEQTQLEMEIEADFEAINLLKKGIIPNSDHHLIIEGGIIFGVLSLLFLKKSTESKSHPNTEERLINAILQLNIADNSIIWDFSLIALKLWDEQFSHNFIWKDKTSSKEQFFEIIKQIKQSHT
ncbi:phage exclusion protein Lit family protein [Flavobacterium oreochromis]|nr:phage exclusion protein Lit family protein [Flavobacterium oreochromis]